MRDKNVAYVMALMNLAGTPRIKQRHAKVAKCMLRTAVALYSGESNPPDKTSTTDIYRDVGLHLRMWDVFIKAEKHLVCAGIPRDHLTSLSLLIFGANPVR